MTRRLLDGYCGAGGCSWGYHLAGFEVEGIDIEPQPRYPFPFHQGDAIEFILAHGHEFDVVVTSPPCQRYSQETPSEYKQNHPDLIGPTRAALRATGKPYVIENVSGARAELIAPVMLCGSMFGLKVWRHRFFEVFDGKTHLLLLTPPCDHSFIPVLVTGTTRRNGYPRKDNTIAEKREAMQIPWMVTDEMDEAIPPAYTEWIGRRLIEALWPERAGEGLQV